MNPDKWVSGFNKEFGKINDTNENGRNCNGIEYELDNKIDERRFEAVKYKIENRINIANDEIERLERFLRSIEAEIADAKDQIRIFNKQFQEIEEFEKGEIKSKNYKRRIRIAKIKIEHQKILEKMNNEQNELLLKVQNDYEKSFENIEIWMKNRIKKESKDIEREIESTRNELKDFNQSFTKIQKDIEMNRTINTYQSLNEKLRKDYNTQISTHMHAHSANASPFKKRINIINDEDLEMNKNLSVFDSLYSSPRKRTQTSKVSQQSKTPIDQRKNIRNIIESINNEDENINEGDIKDRIYKENLEIMKMKEDLQKKGEYRYLELIKHRDRLYEAIYFIEEGERQHDKKIREWKRKLKEQEDRQKVNLEVMEVKYNKEKEVMQKKLQDIINKTEIIKENAKEENRNKEENINHEINEQLAIRKSIIHNPMSEFLKETELNSYRTIIRDTGDIEVWSSDPYTKEEIERLRQMLEFDENTLVQERIRHENLEREVYRMKHELRLSKHRYLYG